MHISIATRWLNDAFFAERFLANWENIADEIIVCDGGSVDKSLSVLTKHPIVTVATFNEQIQGPGGGYRNPEARHVNATLDACNPKTDWIILTHSDIWPNVGLGAMFRRILEEIDADIIRGYIFSVSQDGLHHYPQILGKHKILAWRPAKADVRAVDDRKCETEPLTLRFPKRAKTAYLPMDLHLLHFTNTYKRHIARKRKFMKEVDGKIVPNPDDMYTEKEPLLNSSVWIEPSRPWHNTYAVEEAEILVDRFLQDVEGQDE